MLYNFTDLALNEITAHLGDFQQVVAAAGKALKKIDADKDRDHYSRLVDLILPVLLEMVRFTSI